MPRQKQRPKHWKRCSISYRIAVSRGCSWIRSTSILSTQPCEWCRHAKVKSKVSCITSSDIDVPLAAGRQDIVFLVVGSRPSRPPGPEIFSTSCYGRPGRISASTLPVIKASTVFVKFWLLVTSHARKPKCSNYNRTPLNSIGQLNSHCQPEELDAFNGHPTFTHPLEISTES